MPEETDDALVAAIARATVADVAPEELPLFGALSAAYREDPEAALLEHKGRDDALGFGAEAAMALITPVAMAVSADVLAYLRAEVAKQVKAQGGEAIGELLRRLFTRLRGHAGESPPAVAQEEAALTPAQLVRIHDIAVTRARQLRLSPERAELLATSVVGSLEVAAA